MVLPDRAAEAIEPEWFEEGENIRVADAFVVEIMLNANGQTYDSIIIERAHEVFRGQVKRDSENQPKS